MDKNKEEKFILNDNLDQEQRTREEDAIYNANKPAQDEARAYEARRGPGVKKFVGKEKEKPAFPEEITAGFFLRFFAFLIDSIVAGALGSIIVDGSLNFLDISLTSPIYLGIKTLVFVLYFTLVNLITKGQSLGKLIMGLKVVRLDGKDLKASDIIFREFFGRYIHTYSILPLLYIVTAFTSYKQNLLDYLSSTTVINLSKAKIHYGMEEN